MPREAVRDVLALTPLQRGLYALSRLSRETGGRDLYTVQLAMTFEGEDADDVELLRRCVVRVRERHPQLGGRVVADAAREPVHVVLRGLEPVVEVVDVTGRDEEDRVLAAERRHRFDLDRGPLTRFLLVRDGAGRVTVACTAHHMVIDGWSAMVVFGEILALLRTGGRDELPPPVSIRRHLAWSATRDADAARRHWRDRLDGASRSAVAVAGAGRPDAAPVVVTRVVPDDLARSVDAVRAAHGLTTNTVFQTVVGVLVSRLTDERDVVVGSTVAGRSAEVPGVERIVGALIETIPVRFTPDPASTAVDAAAELQRDLAADAANGFIGLREIQRLAGQDELFDALVVFHNAPGDLDAEEPLGGGLRVAEIRATSLTHFPLVVSPRRRGDRIEFDVECREDRLPSGVTAEVVARRLLVLLREFAEPGARVDDLLGMLPEDAERAAASAPTRRPESVGELFARVAARHPDRCALRDGDRSHTYRGLDEAADRIAADVAAAGGRVGDDVAIVARRGAGVIAALLGVARAGGCAVYLDPALPDARRDAMVRIARPAVALVEPGLGSPLDAARTVVLDDPFGAGERRPPPVRQVPESAALYTIFTSGSSGVPKGVTAHHRGLLALHAHHDAVVLGPTERAKGRPLVVGHAWSLSFDASWQPFLGLLSGHCLDLLDTGVMGDPEALAAAVDERGIDVIELSPTMYAHLERGSGRQRAALERLAVLGLGGEAIAPAMWRRLHERTTGPRVLNFYGPTEGTVDALVAEIHDSPQVVIGRPLAGMRAVVLDGLLRPVPTGGLGTLHLGGPQIAHGYRGRPELTATRFVADPWRPGERLYATGDVVRVDERGDVVYLGRDDGQVKIRGHRIECGEIETALTSVPGVREAAVIPFERPAGKALRAFVVADAEAAPASALRRALAAELPGYMVPADIVRVSRIPMTGNGKRDDAALLDLPLGAAGGGRRPVAAGTATIVLDILAAVLARDPGTIGLEDDLTALGLDSIAVVSMVAACRRAGISTAVSEVVAAVSIADLIDLVESGGRGTPAVVGSAT